MPKRAARFIATAIFDSLPHVIAVMAIYVCLTGKHRDTRAIATVLTAFSVPIVTGVWMMLRVGGMMRRLSSREWRESLALTFLRPQEFLFPRLLPRFVWLLAPLGIALAGLALGLARDFIRDPLRWNAGDYFAVVLTCGIFLAEFFAAGAVAVSGSLDLLLRLCRARSPGLLAVGVPAVWCAILLLGPFLFIAITGMLIGLGEEAGIGFSAAIGWAFAGAMAFDARRRWRILLTAYCDVETIGAGPEEKLLAPPAASDDARKIVIAWIVVNAISNFAAALFTYRGYSVFWGAVTPTTAGLVAGALDGVGQYFVIRRRVRHSLWWIALTAFAGFFAGAIRSDLLRPPRDGSSPEMLQLAIIVCGGATLAGGMVGAAQGALFPRRARSMAIWAVSCALASLLASLLLMGLTPRAPGVMATGWTLASATLGGAFFGAATARPLLYLIKQPLAAEDDSPRANTSADNS